MATIKSETLMSKNTELHDAWSQFIQDWISKAEQSSFPTIESDQDWPSPCEFEKDGKDPLPGAAESIGYLRGVMATM